VDQLIPWLLNEDQQLRRVPFSELIFDTTGRKVLSFEANNAVDQRVAKAISAACDETMKRLNAPDSVIQNVDRINEVSSHFEDTLHDPKLYAAGSRDSSFRTFYFEPKKSTNKVRDDAVHFVVGFEHALRETGSGFPKATWNFTRWDLVDLSRITVKLKAEFQGSNRDMYRPEAIVASSAK